MLTATKRIVKLLSGTALAVVFLVFSVENRQAVTIKFFLLPYMADMPLFLFAIACFVLGVLTGGAVVGLGSWKHQYQHKKAKRRVVALENEIKALHIQQEEKLPAVSSRM